MIGSLKPALVLLAFLSLISAQASATHSLNQVLLIWDTLSEKQTQLDDFKAKYPNIEFKSYQNLPGLTLAIGSGDHTADWMMKNLSNTKGLKVEYDYEVHSSETPNDARYSELWGMSSERDMDINAEEAWDIQTGSTDVVIGVIDSGIDYDHPDLTNNVWVNPNEIADNGIDDDNNGWVDDIYGIDTYNGDGDPFDDNDHGTHVAGTIAAEGDNTIGVVGVNWQAKIISCKFLGEDGSGYTSGAIDCLDYFITLKNDFGIHVVATNNSWGGGGYSESLLNAIEVHAEEDILFVASAGNDSNDNDEDPKYPASYDAINIISVAAHDENGDLASFSNYGDITVDISAPGVDIVSTVPGGGYESFNGTSMAAPHVTGVIGLVAAQYPDTSNLLKKSLVLETYSGSDQLDPYVVTGILRATREAGPGALNCSGSQFVGNLKDSEMTVSEGELFTLTLSNQTCMSPESVISLHDDAGNNYDMKDDGNSPDLIAGDGVYAIEIEADWEGTRVFEVTEGDADDEISVNAPAVADIEEVDYSYVELTNNAISLGLSDDDGALIEPGFEVMLPHGHSTAELFVNSNGTISLEDYYFTDFSNSTLPYFSDVHMLYPYWDDLDPSQNGDVRYEVIGEEPERSVLVEYYEVPHFGGSSDETYTFQIEFYEYKAEIRINYKDVTVSDENSSLGASATVGHEEGGTANQYSYDEAVLDDEMSLLVSGGSDADDASPTITRFEITAGVERPDRDLTFVGEAEASDNNNEPMEMHIDLDDGQGDRPYESGEEVVQAYDIGDYRAKLTAVQGDSERIRYLSFSVTDYTDDERELMDDSYNDGHEDGYQAGSNDGYETGYDDGVDEVVNNPNEYDLTDIVNSSEDIAELEEGKYLLGASIDVTDLDDFFEGVEFVWVYREGIYYGWSGVENGDTRIENSGYEPLTEISAGEGFWIIK